MNWRKIRIGDFLHRVRIPVDIEDDQQYNLVTIRMHHKGVALRGTKPGKEIGSKRMYAVRPGHFILSGIDARHGAFGIVPPELAGAVVTNDFWYFEVDEAQVDKELFLHLTSTTFFDDLCRLASDGTTNRVRLQADKFFNYEISLPPVLEQRELMTQLKHTNAAVASVFAETDQQLAHLTQLRQALLREAMQGQLLPQDPTDEPAAVLLQQLQAAAKPGKKGRGQAGALFAEAAEAVEGPFEIPASWVWCELGELLATSSTGPFGSMLHKHDYVFGQVPLVNPMNIVEGVIIPSDKMTVTPETKKRLSSYILDAGDIVAARRGEMGRCAIVTDKEDGWLCGTGSFFMKLKKVIANEYFVRIFRSEYSKNYLLSASVGSTMNNLNHRILNKLLIPLPPLAEQHRIVAKLAQLLQHCDALEQRIRESRRLAGQLLATALREALAPPAGAPATAGLELVEIAQVPVRRPARRGAQLALGTLLD